MRQCHNLTRRLACRELYGHKAGAAANAVRQFYDALTPNTAVSQCDLPEGHICKYSPDGQYLVCFGAALQQLVVYRFTGQAKVATTRLDQSHSQAQGAALQPAAAQQEQPNAARVNGLHQQQPSEQQRPAAQGQPQPGMQQPPGSGQQGVVMQAATQQGRIGSATFRRIPSLTALVKAEAAAAAGQPSQFKDFFSLVYRSTVCTGSSILAKDVALFPLAGTSPIPLLLLASHTALVDPTRAQQAGVNTPAGAAPGAGDGTRPPTPQVTAVPYVEKTTLHLLNLKTGQQLDCMVLEHDWVPLGGGAGISLLGDLLAVTAVRSQQVLLVQVRRSGSLMQVLQLGPWCREDDQMVVDQAEAAERRWRQERLLAGSQGQSSSRTSIDLKRQRDEVGLSAAPSSRRYRLTDPGARTLHHTLEPQGPTAGRLWFTSHSQQPPLLDTAPATRMSQQGALSRFHVAGTGARALTVPEEDPGPAHMVLLPPPLPVDQPGLAIDGAGTTHRLPEGYASEQPGTGAAHAAAYANQQGVQGGYPDLSLAHAGAQGTQHPHAHPLQRHPDRLPHPQAANLLSVTNQGGAATPHAQHGTQHVPGVPQEGSPGPSGRTAGVDALTTRLHGTVIQAVAGVQRAVHGPGLPQPGRGTPPLDDPPPPEPTAGHASMLFVSGGGPAGAPLGMAMAEQGDDSWDTTNPPLITGLKQRLLAHHMMACMQAARASSSPNRTARAAAKRAMLHSFHAEFETLCNLVIWRAQLVEPDLLLLDLGAPSGPTDAAGGAGPGAGAGAGGAGPQGPGTGPQQSQYIALYNWRKARVRAFLASTSDTAIALLLRYAPLLGSDAGGCGLERFGHTGLHVRMCQDLLAGMLPEAPLPHGPSAGKADTAATDGGTTGVNGHHAHTASNDPAAPWAALALDRPVSRASMDRPTDRLTTVKRVLGLLPGGSQVVSTSPLLDWRLFSYDEKLLLPISRVRPAPDQTIRFYSTSRPGHVAFKIEPGALESVVAAGPAGRPARQVMLPLFHPVVPFAMFVGSAGMGPQSSLSLQYRL